MRPSSQQQLGFFILYSVDSRTVRLYSCTLCVTFRTPAVAPYFFPCLIHLLPNPVLSLPSPTLTPFFFALFILFSFPLWTWTHSHPSPVANDALPRTQEVDVWRKQLRVRFYSDQTTSGYTVQNKFCVRKIYFAFRKIYFAFRKINFAFAKYILRSCFRKSRFCFRSAFLILNIAFC